MHVYHEVSSILDKAIQLFQRVIIRSVEVAVVLVLAVAKLTSSSTVHEHPCSYTCVIVELQFVQWVFYFIQFVFGPCFFEEIRVFKIQYIFFGTFVLR